MDTCVVCGRPIACGEVLCAQCATATAVPGGPALDRCVVCHTSTHGTYDGEFPVCLSCYVSGRLTEEHIIRYMEEA